MRLVLLLLLFSFLGFLKSGFGVVVVVWCGRLWVELLPPSVSVSTRHPKRLYLVIPLLSASRSSALLCLASSLHGEEVSFVGVAYLDLDMEPVVAGLGSAARGFL